MKKIFGFIAIALLVSGLVASFTPVVTADELGNPGTLEVYVSANATATTKASLVALTTIIPGKHKILGYAINPNGATTELLAALYDSATVAAAASTNLFSENEVAAAIDKTKIFPGNGKNLSSGLVIMQGAYTIVEIYYVRYSA